MRYEFPIERVQNSFKGCRHVLEDGVDYSMGTESESESETEFVVKELICCSKACRRNGLNKTAK